MKKYIITSEDFKSVDENETDSNSVVNKTKNSLKPDTFISNLNLFEKIEYYLYKKISAMFAHFSILMVIGIVIAIHKQININDILTVVNLIFLFINMLTIAGRKLQEKKDDIEKHLNLSIDLIQQKQGKIILENTEEILDILKKDKQNESTKF
jgi:hypothetical protein